MTAAHILKWSEHPDKRLDPQNGICLSKLVDKCFEDVLIYIDENYKVQLTDEVRGDAHLYKQLQDYENKKIKLPADKSQRHALAASLCCGADNSVIKKTIISGM